MFITQKATGKKYNVVIEPVTNDEYKSITKAKYFFDWKTEKKFNVYKLTRSDDNTILGLISFENYSADQRIEIKLLSVSIENRGKNKQYERIAGNLIGFVCREAIKYYGELACVSLVPKTQLKKYYIQHYGMLDAGRQVFLDGLPLLKLLKKYEL